MLTQSAAVLTAIRACERSSLPVASTIRRVWTVVKTAGFTETPPVASLRTDAGSPAAP